MSHDSNVSPVGWYVVTYQLRFVELQDTKNDAPDRKFLVWENTVLVQAANLDEAYDKIVAIGLEHTEPYKGGPDGGVDVQWLFEGVVELLPVYQELADGAEIMWAERTQMLKTVRGAAKSKDQFYQRANHAQQADPADVWRGAKRRDRCG
jgi:hypothetical protein